MAFVLADRVKETTTVVGTGAATLLGAATGYQSFSAGIGASNTTYYTIADQSGSNWEVGYGTLDVTGLILTRTTILSSSNAGSAVSFTTGTKDVWCDYTAKKAVYLDSTGNANGLGTPAAFVATNVTGLPLTTGVTGTLPAANGGTAQSTYATGDILYASAANTLSKLNVGTTGQILTVAGGIPSWAAASGGGGGFSGATINAQSSSSLTLTNSSTQIQQIDITAPTTAFVNLPSATTMTQKGATAFEIINEGFNGIITVKNNSGIPIAGVGDGQTLQVNLVDNSTTAGTWNSLLNNNSYTFSTVAGTTNLVSPAGGTSGYFVGLSATQVLYVSDQSYRSGNKPSYCVLGITVGTISGSTITFGSLYTKTTNSIGGGDYTLQGSNWQVIRLSDTTFACQYQNSLSSIYNASCCSSGYQNVTMYSGLVIGTISGSVVTFGANSNQGMQQPNSGNIASANFLNNYFGNADIVRITDTTGLVVYPTSYSIGSWATGQAWPSSNISARAFSVSGTTITYGTAVAGPASTLYSMIGTSGYASNALTPLGNSGTALLGYVNWASNPASSSYVASGISGQQYIVVISVSSTTVTWGTAVTVGSAGTYTGSYTQGAGPNQQICAFSATQGVWVNTRGNTQYATSFTVSGTTPTVQKSGTLSSSYIFNGVPPAIWNSGNSATFVAWTANYYNGRLNSLSPVGTNITLANSYSPYFRNYQIQNASPIALTNLGNPYSVATQMFAMNTSGISNIVTM